MKSIEHKDPVHLEGQVVTTREQQLEQIIARQQRYIETHPREEPRRRFSGATLAAMIIAAIFMVCSIIAHLINKYMEVQAEAAQRAHELALAAINNQPEVIQQSVSSGEASPLAYGALLFVGTAIILYCLKKVGVSPT